MFQNFLKAERGWSGKMEKAKTDMNARVAGRFIGMGLNRRVTVNIAVTAAKFPNFFRTFLFSSLDLFAGLIR